MMMMYVHAQRGELCKSQLIRLKLKGRAHGIRKTACPSGRPVACGMLEFWRRVRESVRAWHIKGFINLASLDVVVKPRNRMLSA